MIIASALRRNGLVLSMDLPEEGGPLRHDHIMQSVVQLGLDVGSWEAGFMTDRGFFLNRIDAADYAVQIGQVSRLSAPPELYDADLW